MKVRVRLLAEQMEKNGAVATHNQSLPALFMGLDDLDDDVIDNASRQAHLILRSVLSFQQHRGGSCCLC